MITDADISTRLRDVEDAAVERKTSSDYRDWIKAAVAFSNSLPIDEIGIVFVGVRNDGTIDERDEKAAESLLQKVSGELKNIYPPIIPQFHVRQIDGKHFVAALINGSQNRPHFAGRAYVRNGTRTEEASKEKFQELIDRRSSKANEILKWRHKSVIVQYLNVEQIVARDGHRVRQQREKVIRTCNHFYLTIQDLEDGKLESVTLERINLSYDHVGEKLIIEVAGL